MTARLRRPLWGYRGAGRVAQGCSVGVLPGVGGHFQLPETTDDRASERAERQVPGKYTARARERRCSSPKRERTGRATGKILDGSPEGVRLFREAARSAGALEAACRRRGAAIGRRRCTSSRRAASKSRRMQTAVTRDGEVSAPGVREDRVTDGQTAGSGNGESGREREGDSSAGGGGRGHLCDWRRRTVGLGAAARDSAPAFGYHHACPQLRCREGVETGGLEWRALGIDGARRSWEGCPAAPALASPVAAAHHQSSLLAATTATGKEPPQPPTASHGHYYLTRPPSHRSRARLSPTPCRLKICTAPGAACALLGHGCMPCKRRKEHRRMPAVYIRK